MSTIRITDLTELTTIDAGNVFIYGANTAASNTSYKIRLNSVSSLTDYSIANAAFLRANVAYSTGFNANVAVLQSGLAYTQANSGFTQANIAYNHAVAGYNYANSVYIHANSAYTLANSSLVYSTAGFNRANAGFSHASSAFDNSNSSFTQANSAFNRANTGVTISGLAFTHANSAFDKANSASDHATAAFNKANTESVTAVAAFNQANAAFNKANTAVLKAGDTITGVVLAPTAANNTSNTMLATTSFVQNSITQRMTGYPIVKAYVIFSVSGSTVTILRSYNVSTVARLATGRYMATYTNALSNAEYPIAAVVSTYNSGGGGGQNGDHTVNIESTSTTNIVVNTADPGLGNNTDHDVWKVWITVFE